MPQVMKANVAELEACQYIANLVYDRCRIKLHEGKNALIKARLGKRMRKHGFAEPGRILRFSAHRGR